MALVRVVHEGPLAYLGLLLAEVGVLGLLDDLGNIVLLALGIDV